MKIDVTKSMFRDAFQKFESTDRCNQLGGYDGLGALYDYLIELEESCGMDIELDPIALCCEYAHYTSIEDYNDDYSTEHESIDDIEETQVIKINADEFIIQQY